MWSIRFSSLLLSQKSIIYPHISIFWKGEKWIVQLILNFNLFGGQSDGQKSSAKFPNKNVYFKCENTELVLIEPLQMG